MSLINCSNCGTIVAKNKSLLCTSCQEAQREEYKRIRAYLAEHPKASVMDVKINTGIPLKIIQAFATDHSIKRKNDIN